MEGVIDKVDRLWLPPASLWAAGLNARQEWEASISPDLLHWKVSWNLNHSHIDRHFTQDIRDTRHCISFIPSKWGIFSQLRDFTDVYLYARANGLYVSVNDCESWPNCPIRGQFLHCMWSEAPYVGICGEPACSQRLKVKSDAYKSINYSRFENVLLQASLRLDLLSTLKWQEVLVTRRGKLFALGVLRAFLVGKYFSVGSSKVEVKVNALSQKLITHSLGNTLVLHVRQTDKKMDMGWHARQEFFPQLHHYAQAIQKLESHANISFGALIFLTDDPSLKSWIYNISLAFQNSVHVMFPSSLWSLGVGHGIGHESLRRQLGKRRTQSMYDDAVAEAMFAGRHGDFIIGCGSSGVSQFISWLIASRKGCDPFGISAWIEDIVNGDSLLKM